MNDNIQYYDFDSIYSNKIIDQSAEQNSLEINPQKNYEGFLFLPSFIESIDNLSEDIPELADELLWAIIKYGTQRIDTSKSPIVKAVMASIKRTIDTGKEKYNNKTKNK